MVVLVRQLLLSFFSFTRVPSPSVFLSIFLHSCSFAFALSPSGLAGCSLVER